MERSDATDFMQIFSKYINKVESEENYFLEHSIESYFKL